MRVRSVCLRALIATFAAAAAVIVAAGAPPAYGVAFVVNTSADHTDDDTCDAADCTLREAIHLANLAPGPDNIDFDIGGGGVKSISLMGPLPEITDPLTIDGTTQPGYAGTPLVELDGTNAGNDTYGLKIGALDVTVRGLVINRFGGTGFGGGILVGSDHTVIEGNYVGTDVSGAVGLGANMRGMSILSGGNIIRDNLISGSDERGLLILSSGNQVVGNRIGTNAAGTAAVPNGKGVEIQNGTGNTIGGTLAEERNLISGNATEGLHIDGSGSTGNTVQGNFIGTDHTGTAAVPNGDNGILIADSGAGNTIGGTTAAARNIISGNASSGVRIDGAGAGNIVQGNYIGTNAGGNAPLGNSLEGVLVIDSPNTTVGGTSAGARNIISGNLIGVQLAGDGTSVVVEGNYIGTSSGGAAALPNQVSGVQITGSGNLIGGSAPGAANVISGNGGDGVFLFSSTATNNQVQGNLIGTAANGSSAVANNDHGIRAEAAGPNILGGLGDGEGNIVAHNGGDGVAIVVGVGASHQDAILGNSIFSNAGLGIDLDDDGVTVNDPPGDGDDGANGRQNFPVLGDVTSDGLGTYINPVSLGSAPGTTFRIEFFASQACDPTGYGEGRQFIGWTQANTDGGGSLSISASLGTAVPGGWYLTATATGPANNTSEFSQCAQVTGAVAPTSTPGSTPANTPSPTPTPTPGGFMIGDADCNHDVDSLDGLWVLRHAAGLPPPPACIASGNVKCDDGITAVDTVLILRHIAGLPDELPAQCFPIGTTPFTLTVNSTADPGSGTCDQSECTFREAISDANSHQGAELIAFHIPPSDPGCDSSGVCTIQPDYLLPFISGGGTVIDGYTQPGANPSTSPPGQPLNAVLKIVLDGNNNGGFSGLAVSGVDNIVRGLVVQRFFPATAIHIRGSAAGNHIEGNFIGTDAGGTQPKGNCDEAISCAGIWLDEGAHDNVVGPNNIVAFNGRGVWITEAIRNTVTRNSVHDNTGPGIDTAFGGNGEPAPPVITSVAGASVAGTACTGCTVEVFSDSVDEGRIYEGSTTADGAGNWALNVSAAGPNVTATATDAGGNTSEFSAPMPVPAP